MSLPSNRAVVRVADLSLLASKPEDVQEVRRRTHASLAK